MCNSGSSALTAVLKHVRAWSHVYPARCWWTSKWTPISFHTNNFVTDILVCVLGHECQSFSKGSPASPDVTCTSPPINKGIQNWIQSSKHGLLQLTSQWLFVGEPAMSHHSRHREHKARTSPAYVEFIISCRRPTVSEYSKLLSKHKFAVVYEEEWGQWEQWQGTQPSPSSGKASWRGRHLTVFQRMDEWKTGW